VSSYGPLPFILFTPKGEGGLVHHFTEWRMHPVDGLQADEIHSWVINEPAGCEGEEFAIARSTENALARRINFVMATTKLVAMPNASILVLAEPDPLDISGFQH